MIQLCRNALQNLIGQTTLPHAGLMLSRGLKEWPQDGEGGGKKKKELIDKVAQLRPSEIYIKALQRWKVATANENGYSSTTALLIGRLYIGVTRDNALETGVTTSHAYGMPMIPGSAVKGLCRAVVEGKGLDSTVGRFMFGSEAEDASGTEEAGGLVFHDAWWDGTKNDKPFVAEIVTPHHQEYYGSEGEIPATDFDSPIPANQIAVQGKFYFAIQGDKAWTEFALKILQLGLTEIGIGGKRTSGYGFFNGQ